MEYRYTVGEWRIGTSALRAGVKKLENKGKLKEIDKI